MLFLVDNIFLIDVLSSQIISYKFKKQLNEETYYQKELSQATSPLFKEVCNAYEATGSLPFTVVWGKIQSNKHQCLDAFETDRDVQMFFKLIATNDMIRIIPFPIRMK